MVLGIDEAGRGPVIGPMVVAGVLIDEHRLPELTELGVKDSKQLTAAKRRWLVPEIERVASKYTTIDVPPVQVDESVMKRARLWKLNYLEAKTMARIIEQSSPDIVFVDSCDVKPDRFAETIRQCLPTSLRETEIISEHKADTKHPIVAAASILAKVRRDEQIEEIKTKYGAVGSGYAHDERTLSFLTKWYEERSRFPDFVRKSWKTTMQIRENVEQTRLPEFASASEAPRTRRRSKRSVSE